MQEQEEVGWEVKSCLALRWGDLWGPSGLKPCDHWFTRHLQGPRGLPEASSPQCPIPLSGGRALLSWIPCTSGPSLDSTL